MIKSSLLMGLCFIIVAEGVASAQSLCPAGVTSNKLICVIPQVFGANGLTLAETTSQGTFQVNFLANNLSSVQSAAAGQAALTPIASPSSGVTYSWDATAKVYVASNDSFGPILGERASVIGKSKLFLAFDYQDLPFSSLDGQNLKKLPVVLPQSDLPITINGATTICSVNGTDPSQNTGDCSFIRDVVVTQNRLDLKIRQFTAFITYGITSRVDVSVVIPIESISMAMSSKVTISRNSSPSVFDHGFTPRPDCPAFCLSNTFFKTGTAAGVGDVTLRVKAAAWTGEKAGLSLGADIRTPTGDAMNLLGAGAAGVKPFVVWSYRSRVSPHAFIGVETNGSSATAGDVATGAKAKLPSQVTYSGGADIIVNKGLTVAADVVGQEVFQTQRTVSSTFTELGQCNDTQALQCDPSAPLLTPPRQDPTLAATTGALNITSLALGVKTNPFSTFLLTANMSIKLNNGGLRARIVPLVGFSYTF